MSSNNVDNKVVNMQFNNAQFEAGVKQTLASLDELKQSLKFNNSVTGLNALSSAFNSFSLANISEQVEALSSRFSTLGIVGMTAIQNITNKMMNLASAKIGGVISQIQTGGWARASSIANARFTLQGMLKDSEKVEEAFKSASNAVDGTAYSLDAAVSAASQLATSGIDTGAEMENVLKSIAGTAAMTGTSFEDISNIFVDTASAGRLTGDALMRLSLRGINAKQILADSMGYTTEQITQMTSKGEISFQEFSKAMQDTFGEHAKEANKTFQGVMSNIKSALSRIGAIFASGIIENEDFISALNDVREAINKVKTALMPLEDNANFKNMISALSRLGSKYIKTFSTKTLERFVYWVGLGMDKITEWADKLTGYKEAAKETLFGKVADDAEKASEVVHATAEEIQAAVDIWTKVNYGGWGTMQDRWDKLNKELGDGAAERVQYLVNQEAAGVKDLENVSLDSLTKIEKSTDDVASSAAKVTEEVEDTGEALIPVDDIMAGLSKYAKGLKTIIGNIKTTVVKAVTAFRKVFSWKKLTDDISDYGEAFSEFIGYFEIGEERATKLENSFSGLWSLVDLLRKGIKLLITGGLKILGPSLSFIFDVVLTLTSAIGVALTKFNEWTEKTTGLRAIIVRLYEALSKAVGIVKEFFIRLWNLPAVKQIKESLSELASLVGEKLLTYFEKAVDAISDFFDSFDSGDGDTMDRVLGGINTALEDMITFSSDAKTNVSDLMSWFTEGASNILGFKTETKNAKYEIDKMKQSGDKLLKSDSVGSFMTNASNTASLMGVSISGLVDSLIGKFNKLDASKVALISTGGAMSLLSLSMSYLTYNMGDFLKTITAFPTEMVNTVKSIRMLINSMGTYLLNKSQAEILKAFALAVVAVAAAFFVLANYADKEGLETVAQTMGIMIGLMTLMMVSMGHMAAKFAKEPAYFKTLYGFAALLIGMAAAVLLLAIALQEFAKIKFDKDIIAPCIALVTTMGLLIGVAFLMNKVGGEFNSASFSVLVMASSLFIIVKALKSLVTLDTTSIMDKIIALEAVLATLGGIAALLGAFGTTFSGSLAILTLIGSIYLIELTLNYIAVAGISMDTIKKNFDKFTPILAALGIIAAFLVAVGLTCKNTSSMAATIIATAISIYIIVQALKQVAELSSWEIVKGIVTVGFIILALMKVLKLLVSYNAVAKRAGSTLLRVSLAIGLLAIVLAAVSTLTVGEIGKGILAVGALTVLIAGLIFVSQFGKQIDYKTIYAVVVAIGILALIIGIMSTFDDEELMNAYAAAGIMSLALISFGMSMMLAGKYALRLKLGPLIAMVVALGLIASALVVLSLVGNIGKMLTTALAISGILLSLASSMAIMSKAMGKTNFLKKGRLLTIITMIGMLALVATALYYLSSRSSEQIAWAALGIIAVMVTVMFSFTELVKRIKEINITKSTIATLGIMVGMIFVLGVIMTAIIAVSSGKSLPNLIVVVAGLILLIYTMSVAIGTTIKSLNATSINSSVLAALAIMAGVIFVIGGVLTAIIAVTSVTNSGRIAVAIAGLLVVLVAVVDVMVFIQNNFVAFNPAVLGYALVGIALLVSVAAAMNLLLNGNNADWKKMLAAAGSMAIVISVLAAVIGVLTVISTTTGIIPALVVLGGLAVVLLSLSVAFRAFARVAKASVEALKLLSEIDMSGIDTVKLLQLVGILNLAIISCYLAGPAFISLSLGIVSLGLAVSVLATGLLVLSIPLIATAKAFQSLISVISDTNGDIASKIAAIGAAFAESITSFVTTLAIKAPVIKASLILLMATTASVITEGINNVTEIVLNGIVNFLTKLDNKLPEITEKVNSIITTILKSIADNAETFGYYGIYISVMFLYGVAEGFNEVAPYLGELLSDIITGLIKVIDSALDSLLPGIGDKLYDFYLEQAELLYGLLSEWSSGVGALTGGVAGLNGVWESGYQAIVEERAARAEEKSQDVGKAMDEGTAKGIEDNADKVDKAAQKAVSNATNQSKAASEGAKTTGDSYGTGLTDTISGYKDKIKDKITGVVNNEGLNMNFGTAGMDGASTYLSNFESGVREEKIDLTGMDDSIKQHYLDAGYEYSEDGKYLVKQIKEGSAQEAASFGDIWEDNADVSLMNAMDDTNENMAEKATEGKDYYIDGLVDFSDEDLRKVREAYARIGHEAHEAVVSPEGLDENSPSKKGKKAAFYYAESLIIGIRERQSAIISAYSDMAGKVCSEAASMMASISSIVQDDSINWTPTITPVVDASQLQNGSQMLENAFGDSALNMAASTSLSVNSSSQATLATQVQSLSEQVKKLADTDYSKILEGVNFNIDASTNVDGTPLKRIASKFTIQQIDDQTKTYNMALGGRA